MGYTIDFSGLSLASSGKVQRTFATVDTEAQRDFDIIRYYYIFFSVSLCLCGNVVNPYYSQAPKDLNSLPRYRGYPSGLRRCKSLGF